MPAVERVLVAAPGNSPRLVVPVMLRGAPRWFRVSHVADDGRVMFELVELAPRQRHVGRLTAEDKLEIDDLRAEGETVSGISAKLNIVEGTVRNYVEQAS